MMMAAIRILTLGFFIAASSACGSPGPRPALVVPIAETAPAPSSEDAADDPAIWVNASRPETARILGTDKQTGLYVYDMAGALVQSLPIGPLNNVDLRQETDGFAFDVAVASNDAINAVSVFAIDRGDGAVVHVGDVETGKVEPYGICIGEGDGDLRVFVTYKDGEVQEFSLKPFAAGDAPVAVLENRRALATQLEGCVVDEENRLLFVGEEAAGVWAFDLDDAGHAPAMVDKVGGASGLAADVEGVSLWRGLNGEGWLVVSAQGRSRFVVYDRKPPFAPRGSIKIVDSGAPVIDRVTGTDGLDISSANLGGAFSRGVLVVQDDVNSSPAANQNFKIVDWRAIENVLGLPTLEPAEPPSGDATSEQ